MSQPIYRPRYRGVFPVVPTIFDDDGRLDLAGQKRCIDFMIDAGADGLCILANFSEQFALSDDERSMLTGVVLDHVAGRVPMIVTTTHFSLQVCAQRSRRAQDAGAAMVMIMPPYHGATIRVGERGIYEFFTAVSNAIDIPIMIQVQNCKPPLDQPASRRETATTSIAKDQRSYAVSAGASRASTSRSTSLGLPKRLT